MNMITSKQNEKVKQLKLLKANKQFAFLDNPKLIEEAILAGYNLECLIVNEKQNIECLKQKFNLDECNILQLSNSVFEIFSSTCSSQGVIGVVKNKTQSLKTPNENFLILDNLQDPGNVGTLLRSALGADFKDVYLVDCVNILNDKLVRSSMGAIFKLNVFECNKNEFLQFYKNNLKNFDIFAAHMEGDSLFSLQTKSNFGIILGNEGNGVSEEMFEIANKKVSIPMKNNLESLNVAIAGSILMFELNKNLR